MDNPRKKKEDSKRVSQQPHEFAYQKRKAAGSARDMGPSKAGNESNERNRERAARKHGGKP